MRTFSMNAITGAALATLLCAFSAFAHDHSALNGTWTLVPVKSDFAGQPVIQTGTVTISSEGDVIIVTRSFAYEGASETFFYKDMTDAQNSATIHSGKESNHHAIRRGHRRKLLPNPGWHHAGQRRQAGPQADHLSL
jgi:hypothetical protein